MSTLKLEIGELVGTVPGRTGAIRRGYASVKPVVDFWPGCRLNLVRVPDHPPWRCPCDVELPRPFVLYAEATRARGKTLHDLQASYDVRG